MVIRLGIIGFSLDNGHPFSFSAIVNGYKSDQLRESGWGVIADYLDLRATEEFGIKDVRITHVWCPDTKMSKQVSLACNVENACNDYVDMIGEVDGVIIARDDWQSHFEIASHFLHLGVPVFIDKPLTIDLRELRYFEEYLYSGQLMSCSGLRYSTEIKGLEVEYDNLIHTSAVVINDFEKYGIHMLEILTTIDYHFAYPSQIIRLDTSHESFLFKYANGSSMSLNCLGSSAKAFEVSMFGRKQNHILSINDNFGAFKQTLSKFVDMVRTKNSPIPIRETISLMLIIAAASSLNRGDSIDFLEFKADVSKKWKINAER